MLEKKKSVITNVDNYILFNRELNTMFDENIARQLAKYVIYKIADKHNLEEFTYKDFINNKLYLDDDVRFLIEQKIGKKHWKEVLNIGIKYNIDLAILKKMLLESDMNPSDSLSKEICEFILSLLDIKDTESVIDLYCGTGALLSYLRCNVNATNVPYTGVDINNENIVLAKIRNDVWLENVQYLQKNIFNLSSMEDKKVYDKIISIYPVGIPLRSLKYASEYTEQLLKKSNASAKLTSADWIYNSVICDLLSEKGKGIAIMASGGTWNGSDKEIRKYFIERGLIECVISFPVKEFEHTNLPTSLIVFSRGNKNISFIDLTDMYKAKIKKEYYLYPEFINANEEKEEAGEDTPFYNRRVPGYILRKVIPMLGKNTSISKVVSLQEIRKNDYILSPIYYMDKKITFENAVCFESIITNITRGVSCSSDDINNIVSSYETQYKYLTVSNISNGLIDDNLASLKSIDKKYDKYCLKNNDLIISKSGFPYKIAVSEINQSKVLVNSNLYIITLDETKANPFYIKAFLDSKRGQYLLKRASVGSIIPNISVAAIKKIQIPLPSLSEQNRIANLLLAAKDEYLINKSRMEKSADKFLNVYDNNIKE